MFCLGLDGFIEEYLNIILLVIGVLSVISIVSIVYSFLKLKGLTKPFSEMAEYHKETGTKKALEKLLKGVDENREYIRGHSDEIKKILKNLDICYRGTGIVKFNAFDDIGGMQSYSLCLLTLEKNGFILTNLVGRNSTRGYALDVKNGVPSRDLSDEEKEALAYAVKSLSE